MGKIRDKKDNRRRTDGRESIASTVSTAPLARATEAGAGFRWRFERLPYLAYEFIQTTPTIEMFSGESLHKSEADVDFGGLK